MEGRIEKAEYVLCFLTAGLIPLHLYLSFLNLVHGIAKGYRHSYPVRSYVLTGVYLGIVLAVDGFMIWQGRFEVGKGLSRYWGSSSIGIAAVIVMVAAAQGGGDISLVILLYSPFAALAPLFEFLGLKGTLPNLAVAEVFCLINYGIMQRPPRRRKIR